MNGHAPSRMGYSERLEAFRQSDAEREQMVTELIRSYDELSLKYDQTRDDLGNEIESRRMWQSKANSSERALTEQRQASVCNEGGCESVAAVC